MNEIERSSPQQAFWWLDGASSLKVSLNNVLPLSVRSGVVQNLPAEREPDFFYGTHTVVGQSHFAEFLGGLFEVFARAWRACEQWYAEALSQRGIEAAPTFEGHSPLQSEVLPWKKLINNAAVRHEIDPALIAAIISRESRGKNIIGDYGHGRGLMQIDDRWHREFLDSNYDGLEPGANIDYGTKLLRANLDRFDGDVRAAIAAYNAGVGAVHRALGQGKDVDRVTTGGNYSSDILARTEIMKDLFPD